jgi:hypothetical protein
LVYIILNCSNRKIYQTQWNGKNTNVFVLPGKFINSPNYITY